MSYEAVLRRKRFCAGAGALTVTLAGRMVPSADASWRALALRVLAVPTQFAEKVDTQLVTVVIHT